MDVSRSFHERFPGVKLDSEKFSVVSKLFQEAVQRNEQGLLPETNSAGGESLTSTHQISPSRVNMESQSIGPSATEMAGMYR
jgi:hypothetical protein